MPPCKKRRQESRRRLPTSVSFFLFLVCLGFMVMSSPAAVANLTPEQQAWLKQHPTIRVGLDPAWPPFSYYSRDGHMVGMDVDMLNLLEQRLGVKFVIVSGKTWSEVYAKFQSGELDMLAGIAKTPERASVLDFSDSYIEFPSGIITRVDAPFMVGLAQMEGKKIAAPRDYAPTLLLQREYPGLELVMTENLSEALQLVSQGHAYATIDNLASANYLIKDHGLGNLKVAGITNYQFALRYGVRKDWPELTASIQQALLSISDRDRETIKDRWIDLDVDKMLFSRRKEKILLICVGVIAGLALFVVGWNRLLAREVARRKLAERELHDARNKAIDASRMKSAFLANVSHEIRNPLNAVLGFTELLKLQASEPKLKKYVEGVDAGGRTLLGIINDVLDMSKVEAGHLEIHKAPVDLRIIISETHALFVTRAAQRGLEFIQDISPEVPTLLFLDELRLRQVLYNAVTNAIKFTSEGSVRLSARCAPKGRKSETISLIIEVADTGPGIPPEDHQRIFEPFAQREGQSPLLGGSGLGLAISKRLTELMGGRLELDSALGKGCIFRFVFPDLEVATSDSHPVSAPSGSLTDFTALRVLVIDDLESNRELLKEHFQSAGHHVWDAADAEHGIVVAQSLCPDLILLDFRLPGMDGREAARQLRNDPRTAGIPVIFLSGSMQEEGEVLDSGNCCVLAKPLIYAELIVVLRQLLPKAIKEAPIT